MSLGKLAEYTSTACGTRSGLGRSNPLLSAELRERASADRKHGEQRRRVLANQEQIALPRR